MWNPHSVAGPGNFRHHGDASAVRLAAELCPNLEVTMSTATTVVKPWGETWEKGGDMKTWDLALESNNSHHDTET